MTQWKPASEKPDFGTSGGPQVWVRRELSGVELAEFDGRCFRPYGDSMDSECRGMQALSDVTHWAYVIEPQFVPATQCNETISSGRDARGRSESGVLIDV